MKIHKGDTIRIITGKDKGKTGKILKTFPKKNRILIEGLNLYKKHVKPKKQGEKGQVVLVPRPVDISNVAIICPACNKNAKVGNRLESGSKARYCKRCKAKI